MKKIQLLLPLVFASFVVGCVTQPEIQTQTVSAPLESAPAVPTVVGQTWVYSVDGEDVTYIVTAVDKGVVTIESSQGCVAARDVSNLFAPVTMWNNCGGNSGTAKVTSVEGQLWPLELGKVQTQQISGENNGRAYQSTRKCVVRAAERVGAPIGTYDTYKVTCDDKWTARTWYYSPELGTHVRFLRESRGGGKRRSGELVSVGAS